jgi:predicted small lipoprotein YifL
MKKVLVIMSVLIIMFAFVSCGSKPEEAPAGNDVNAANQGGADLPEFFLFPPQAKDAIYGIGSHKSKDLSIAREVATTRARADIAKQVSVSVQTMLTDYFQEAGVGDEKQSVEMVEKVTKEVADIELKGATTKEVYVTKDMTQVFVLVEYPTNTFIDEQVAEVFKRNESAAFAEFKADQALAQLKAEVDNNPPASEPTIE